MTTMIVQTTQLHMNAETAEQTVPARLLPLEKMAYLLVNDAMEHLSTQLT